LKRVARIFGRNEEDKCPALGEIQTHDLKVRGVSYQVKLGAHIKRHYYRCRIISEVIIMTSIFYN